MDNEIRFVHREETFNDLAVRELAAGRSACICRLQFGRCTKSECYNCAIAKQYNACYSQLTDYDKQRLATYVNECYVQDSLYPQKWMSYNKLCLNTAKWIVICLVCLILFFIPLAMLSAEETNISIIPELRPRTAYGYDTELEGRIYRLNKEVKLKVIDFNKDNMINCIDHTVLWKVLWDKYYPDESDRCIIVRIFNNRIHHLCVGVYDDYSKLVLVETQSGTSKYYFLEFWFWKTFSEKDIIYGETERWLIMTK